VGEIEDMAEYSSPNKNGWLREAIAPATGTVRV
jgi:hypothetical protein